MIIIIHPFSQVFPNPNLKIQFMIVTQFNMYGMENLKKESYHLSSLRKFLFPPTYLQKRNFIKDNIRVQVDTWLMESKMELIHW